MQPLYLIPLHLEQFLVFLLYVLSLGDGRMFQNIVRTAEKVYPQTIDICLFYVCFISGRQLVSLVNTWIFLISLHELLS